MYVAYDHLLLDFLHSLQLLMELLGKRRIRVSERGRNRVKESYRVSFKAVCGCVIESWSSCACLTHWLMAGCLDSHTRSRTHTYGEGLTYQRCPTPHIPLHYPPLPFPSPPPPLFFSHSFTSSSSSLCSLPHTLPLLPLTVKVHRRRPILHPMSHV